MTNIIFKFKLYLRKKKLKKIRKKQQEDHDRATFGNNKNFIVNNNIESPPNSTVINSNQTSPKKVRFSILSTRSRKHNSLQKDQINTINSLPTPPNTNTFVQIGQSPIIEQNLSMQQLSPSLGDSQKSILKKSNHDMAKAQQLEKPLPKCPANNSKETITNNEPKYNDPSFDDQMSEYKKLQKERYQKVNPNQPNQYHPVSNLGASPRTNPSLISTNHNTSVGNLSNLSSSGGGLTSSGTRIPTSLTSSSNHLKRSSGRLKVSTSEYNEIYVSSKEGGLWINDLPLKLKGINWFGCETETFVVHGLWKRDYKEYIKFLADNNFNLVRIPFSYEMIIKDPIPTSITVTATMNSDLRGLRSLSVLDLLISELADKGIFVLLDFHSFGPNDRLSDGLWYNSKYSEADTLKAWRILILRYRNVWNVLGVDLKNEPFSATWNTGNLETDWDKAINRIGSYIQNNGGKKWLIFAQGVSTQKCSDIFCCWGESFESEGIEGEPSVSLPLYDKLVYSPHVYGPSVVSNPNFRNPSFPYNFHPHWDMNFGDLPMNTGRAMVVSEWGGRYEDPLDKLWMNSFVQYLIDKRSTDNIFWCLNPNSGDTGGLLKDDWVTVNNEKLDLLAKLSPHPTKITYDNDTCLYKIVSIDF